MGTICILLGIIMLFAFSGGGFVLTNMFASKMIMGNPMLQFLGFSNTASAYVVIVGACTFIGLLICLNLVMLGLIYNRTCKNGAVSNKKKHHHD